MADLYDKISAPAEKPKRRRDSLTVVLLLVGLGIICIAVILVYQWFHNDKLYDDYVSDLSRSTVTVNDTGCLFAKIDGETYILDVEKTYKLYQKLTHSKQLMQSDDMPRGSGIRVEYGDGSVLRILYTDIDVSSWSRNTGIFVSYTNSEGDEFSYITDRLQYDALVEYLTE